MQARHRWVAVLATAAAAATATAASSGPVGAAPASLHGVARFLIIRQSAANAPTRLVSMAVDGSDRRVIAARNIFGAVPSHDGRFLAYEQHPSSNQFTPSALVIARADGSHPRALTSPRQWAYAPAWTPDDRSLVFGRGADLSARTGLWRIGADGHGLRPIPHTYQGTDPVVFPSGRRLAYVKGFQPCCDAFTLNLDGSAKRALSRHPGSLSPSVSPDGQRIAFRVDAPGSTFDHPRSEIAVESVNGGPIHRLASTAGCAFDPRWSPDGLVIFFVHCTVLVHPGQVDAHDGIAEVTPDGAHVRALLPRLGGIDQFTLLPSQPTAPAASGRSSAVPGATTRAPGIVSRAPNAASSPAAATEPRTGPRGSAGRGTGIGLAAALLVIAAGAWVVTRVRSRV